MKYLGSVRRILGMEIERNRSVRTLFLSYSKYIDKLLIKFNVFDSRVVSTPLA